MALAKIDEHPLSDCRLSYKSAKFILCGLKLMINVRIAMPPFRWYSLFGTYSGNDGQRIFLHVALCAYK